jgi:hypothetical protein
MDLGTNWLSFGVRSTVARIYRVPAFRGHGPTHTGRAPRASHLVLRVRYGGDEPLAGTVLLLFTYSISLPLYP